MAASLSSSKPPASTRFFSIDRFGFHINSIYESHGEWLYPTPNDRNPAGWFALDPHNLLTGDFNGDGIQDLAVVWLVLPHVIERETVVVPSVFLGDGAGGYGPANVVMDGAMPERHMLYRSGIADFNRDGADDLLMTSMGLLARDPSQPTGYRSDFEPIALLLSDGEGHLADASTAIEGQASEGLPDGFTFGHDASVGDVDGDGWPDMFTGKVLFRGDGQGGFENVSEWLPDVLRNAFLPVISSAMGDLNGDQMDDLVVLLFEGGLRLALLSGSEGVRNASVVELPAGNYGPSNTKDNYVVLFDVNLDGLDDIVVAETRAQPYYEGKSLQILINQGGGRFVDETASRVDNSGFDALHGEGQLFVLDVNRDGTMDLVHSTGPTYRPDAPPLGSARILINRGDGVFYDVDQDVFPIVQPWNFAGFEGATFLSGYLNRVVPVDTGNPNGLDFVSFVTAPQGNWPPTEPFETAAFIYRSQLPLMRGEFHGTHYALDIDGAAGQVARILGAVFGPSAVANQTYAGIGLGLLDAGVSYGHLMQLALQARLGPAATHADIVQLLYTNVVGNPPPPSDQAFYLGLLDSGAISPVGLAVLAADTPLNAANVDLVGLTETGLAYQPFDA